MKKLIWATVIFIGSYFIIKKSYRVFKEVTDFSGLDFDGIKWDGT